MSDAPVAPTPPEAGSDGRLYRPPHYAPFVALALALLIGVASAYGAILSYINDQLLKKSRAFGATKTTMYCDPLAPQARK